MLTVAAVLIHGKAPRFHHWKRGTTLPGNSIHKSKFPMLFQKTKRRERQTRMLAMALLQSVRRWIDGIEVHDRKLANCLCQLIPNQCPFERDVKLCGRSLFHIPPLCKLNPFYEQLVGLRFRALCYLVEERSFEVTAPKNLCSSIH